LYNSHTKVHGLLDGNVKPLRGTSKACNKPARTNVYSSTIAQRPKAKKSPL
jgi:hypothetical protein